LGRLDEFECHGQAGFRCISVACPEGERPPVVDHHRPVVADAAVFPGDITLRPLAERDHNLVRWTEYQQGGHFPALEVPELLVEDVRTFFRGLR
jgi:hypothetical protein